VEPFPSAAATVVGRRGLREQALGGDEAVVELRRHGRRAGGGQCVLPAQGGADRRGLDRGCIDADGVCMRHARAATRRVE
jgi:hypothetical protein